MVCSLNWSHCFVAQEHWTMVTSIRPIEMPSDAWRKTDNTTRSIVPHVWTWKNSFLLSNLLLEFAFPMVIKNSTLHWVYGDSFPRKRKKEKNNNIMSCVLLWTGTNSTLINSSHSFSFYRLPKNNRFPSWAFFVDHPFWSNFMRFKIIWKSNEIFRNQSAKRFPFRLPLPLSLSWSNQSIRWSWNRFISIIIGWWIAKIFDIDDCRRIFSFQVWKKKYRERMVRLSSTTFCHELMVESPMDTPTFLWWSIFIHSTKWNKEKDSRALEIVLYFDCENP